jgi:hypothetical protein
MERGLERVARFCFWDECGEARSVGGSGELGLGNFWGRLKRLTSCINMSSSVSSNVSKVICCVTTSSSASVWFGPMEIDWELGHDGGIGTRQY